MKIEGTGEVTPQVENETAVVEEANTQQPVKTTEEEVVLPSDEGTELIAGKFKSQEDLLKSYKELEAKLGQPTEDIDSMSDEDFINNIDSILGEESTKEPEVDEEYEAYKAKKAQDTMLKDIGGLDAYNNAIQWASKNMSVEDINDFNSAMEAAGGNEVVIKQLAKSLISRATTTTSTPTTLDPLHGGETGRVDSIRGYETKSDMMKDMSDPRYEKDEGFRQAVAKKLSVTDEARWYAGYARGG